MKPFSIVVCSVFLLVACGQKGPLYLPDEAPPAKPYSECDAADAPCREPTAQTPAPATPAPTPTESSTPPSASSPESTTP